MAFLFPVQVPGLEPESELARVPEPGPEPERQAGPKHGRPWTVLAGTLPLVQMQIQP